MGSDIYALQSVKTTLAFDGAAQDEVWEGCDVARTPDQDAIWEMQVETTGAARTRGGEKRSARDFNVRERAKV